MPRPLDSGQRYLPGLDGLRAIAVALVIGYHLQAPGMGGGLLGVAVFFTLSGYLITSLLRRNYEKTGGIDLVTFWIRRARRLLPAVISVLIVVLALTLFTDTDVLPARGVEALGALFYVANWVTIGQGVSYFQRFEEPSPLSHLWSLAVEEQFYVVWPLLLLGLLVVLRSRKRAAVATFLLACGSFTLLAMLHTPGLDNTRAYEGTDTRAGGLLLGAVLALLWRPRESAMPTRRFFDLLGVIGLGGIAYLVMHTDEYSPALYKYGLLALTVSTVMVVAAAVQPGTFISRILGVAPLTWLGERSYGIYLWHLPVMSFMPRAIFPSFPWLRGLVVVIITLLVSALSWRLIEQPIRKHGFRKTWTAMQQPDKLARASAVLLTSALVVALAGGAAWAGTQFANAVRPPTAAELAPRKADGAGGPDLDNPGVGGGPAPTAAPTPTTEPSSTSSATPTATTSGPAPNPPTGGKQTSCTQVVHIGESTSLGFIRPDYVPNAGDRVEAQYKRVGVGTFISEIEGARSIIETVGSVPNAQAVVDKRLSNGYKGCWVIAMGTNESANLHVGGPSSPRGRIDLLMKKIPADQPVLWLTVRTILNKGPYNDAGMQRFNEALNQAANDYPNMRVYDWANEVQREWYIFDGIHFSTAGYIERSRRLADALAVAFPKGGSWSSAKLVGSAG